MSKSASAPHFSDPPPVRWVEVARWCSARGGALLTAKEAHFLQKLDLGGDVDLSSRQAAWLATIYAELRLEASEG